MLKVWMLKMRLPFLDMMVKFFCKKREQADYGFSSVEMYHFFVGILSLKVNSLCEGKRKGGSF